jgi:hypothetical protein
MSRLSGVVISAGRISPSENKSDQPPIVEVEKVLIDSAFDCLGKIIGGFK